jgi:hypothetical protein
MAQLKLFMMLKLFQKNIFNPNNLIYFYENKDSIKDELIKKKIFNIKNNYKIDIYDNINLYEELNKGGNPMIPTEIFLGCISEIYFDIFNRAAVNYKFVSSDVEGTDEENDEVKKYLKENIIKKIKKYIKLGGFIQVSNKTIPPHSFSLNNYREI